jgi:hypothetical protein
MGVHQPVFLNVKRALLAGHFSTVGDIEVLNQVKRRLESLGIEYDVCPYSFKLSAEIEGWLNKEFLKPEIYSHLIVICGPFFKTLEERNPSIFAALGHCVWIGVNLTMVEPIADYNPFDVLLERDGDRAARPDLSLLEVVPPLPLVGVCLVHPQTEYGDRQRHEMADAAIRRLVKRANVAVIELSTDWPLFRNSGQIESPEQFETICRKLDVMVTTRLHGTVIALKNGVPVISVDAVAGGDKLTRQARLLGWPEIFSADTVTDDELDAALARCLEPAAREKALACVAAGRGALQGVFAEFEAALALPQGGIVRRRRVTHGIAAYVRALRMRRKLRKYKKRG